MPDATAPDAAAPATGAPATGAAAAALPGATGLGAAATGPGQPADLLGRPLAEADAAVLDAYHRLRALTARADLSPCAAANCKHALSYLAQAVTSLGLEFEHLIDIGV